MRNGKTPTRNQKMFIKKNGYNPNDFLVIKIDTFKKWLFVRNKKTGEVFSINGYDQFFLY